MYCWSCGKEVKENLNYCSGCGARVEKDESEDYSSSWMNNPSTSVGYLGIFGLGGFIFLVIQLLKRELDPSFVFALCALYLAALFGICFMILRQTSNRPEKPANKDYAEPDYVKPKTFRSKITNQLESPSSEPIPSVTENTTRTLDKILVKRK